MLAPYSHSEMDSYKVCKKRIKSLVVWKVRTNFTFFLLERIYKIYKENKCTNALYTFFSFRKKLSQKDHIIYMSYVAFAMKLHLLSNYAYDVSQLGQYLVSTYKLIRFWSWCYDLTTYIKLALQTSFNIKSIFSIVTGKHISEKLIFTETLLYQTRDKL